MDDKQTTNVFANRDEPIPIVRMAGPPSHSRSASASQLSTTTTNDAASSDAEVTPPKATKRKGIRDRLSAFRDKASLQDRLVEKLLAQVLAEDVQDLPQGGGGGGDGASSSKGGSGGGGGAPGSPTVARPPFSLPTMSTNFRRFNTRIGVVFVFQNRVVRLLSWKQPSHTLAFLAVYTLVCLDPALLPLLPLAVLLVGVMVPYFVARHPAAPSTLDSTEQALAGYSPRGPPLAPAVTVKPVKELSRDFFRNMRDLQNSMEDFSQLHDAVVTLLVPRMNFSDEALSTAVFVGLFALALLMSIAAGALPWRLIFLLGGWGLVVASHPAVQRKLQSVHGGEHVKLQGEKAQGVVEKWVERDIILDSAPETREVEIFELQRLSDEAGEWEAWLFSPSPYDPLSPARIGAERPAGTLFFEDVQPPPGWEWSEKKWALDLWSREWVEERIITGVEVETEGERWVYDIYDENEAADRIGVVDGNYQTGGTPTTKGKGKASYQRPSWEEGDDYEGRRGEWRRRRWVRTVKRKNISSAEEVVS